MKKYHKLHRHKDAGHKRSSKQKHRQKPKKDPVSESILEPIQEISQEKVKLDKNACGDFVAPQIEDDRKKKSKHPSGEKQEKTDKNEKLDQEQINIFAQNYLRKLRESTNEKLVRHHSLEKDGGNLINRTKNIFRKEKSFNDAVKKVSVDLEVDIKEHKRERKRRHRSEKSEKDEIIKEKREKHINREKSPKKRDKESRGDHRVQGRERKHKNTREKQRARSSVKSPGKTLYNRVQEVIYCQMDQVPYKLRNDKSGAEIKDLYQRIRTEKSRGKERDGATKELSHLRDEGKTKHDLKKYTSYQSHHIPLDSKIIIQEEKKSHRSKSRSKRKPEEHIQKEKRPESVSKEHDTVGKRHKKHGHHDSVGLLEDNSKKGGAKKRKKCSLSNVDLGPFQKYFAFENNVCDHKKHRKKYDEPTRKEKRSSREKKHRENQEEVIYSVEYEHTSSKRHHTRHEGKTENTEENKLRSDEDKIHQIVEGDLKTYFTKIQHMIDKKLDVIIQINKSRHEKSSDTMLKERKNRKRSKSRSKPTKSEKEESSGSKKKGKINAAGKTKHDEEDTREEIIQEVLRRIKNEEKVQPISDKDFVIKHDSKDTCDKISKRDSKNIKELSKTCKKCQEPKKVHSRTQGVSLIQKPLIHPDEIKNSEQKVLYSSPLNSTGKKHEEAKGLQNMEDMRQIKPSRHHDGRPGFKEHRCPDIPKTNNSQEISFRKTLDKNRHSTDKQSLPKDSLDHNHGPPLELIIPAADISRVEWEAYLKSKRRYRNPYTGGISVKEDLSHSLRKHYTSVSSCKACSEHHLPAEQKSEQLVPRQHDDRCVANNGMRRERGNSDRRKSSSPERCYKMFEETNRDDQSHILYHKNDEMLSVDHKTHTLMVSHDDDYIMTPRHHRKSKDRRRSRHDVVVPCADHNLETIILPPAMFRTPRRRPNDLREKVKTPERQHIRQEFLVQGIEPPILECSRQKSKGRIRIRNLECKTVSVIGIPPQIIVRNVPVTNVTQTSSKSQKSSNLDEDLVEKRKQSKRFKLYYKYSVINNCKEDSGTSEAKSIVSDSYRIVSDPSDEEQSVCYSRDIKITKEEQITSELSQVVNIPPKKWNRVSTPRDSHLNNIIEEPSNISNTIKNDEFFLPIVGTNECYFRAFTSSHSEYCFKINKKPANSNISIVSKDRNEGRYKYYDDGRCRYCKRSKSEVSVVSNFQGIQILRSKSDVFLAGASGRKVIKSIFLEDTHTYAKSKRVPASLQRNDAPQTVYKQNDITRTAGKVCQTSDEKMDYDVIPVDEGGNELVIEDKQRQFKNIYKTIDDLVENIHSSRRTPPNTLDIAVSSRFLSLDTLSDKKPIFKEIYKTIDTLQNKMRDSSSTQLVERVDVGIGSSVKIPRTRRASRSEPRRNTHEVAVGDSKDRMARKGRTPGYRSESRGKRLKSTGVSPIRVVEDLQNSSKSPTRKTMTPISPNIRPYLSRPTTQKPTRTTRDDIPKKTVPIVVETRRDPISLRPKLLVVKNTKIKSPERTELVENQKKSGPVDASQPVQGIRILKSEEKSTTLKKRENIQPRENTTNSTEKNQTCQKEKSHLVQPNVLENDKTNNNTQISTKASARKCTTQGKGGVKKTHSRTSDDDDVHKSCVHHYHPRESSCRKSSRSTAPLIKTAAGPVQTPVTVNTAVVNSRPASKKKTIPGGGSTSSSLGDDSGQNMIRNRSLVEVRARNKNVNRSKSEIISVDNTLLICNSRGLETNAESVISGNMEKYANVPRLRCQSSKSAIHSLDQFIGNKFTSTLLLTKDYKGGEISSYQRRKLYDQSIRQKMKKKFRFSKLDVGPQIFEVRFLSMVRQENALRKEKEARMKNHLDRHLVTLNLEKAKTEGNFYHRKNSLIVKDDDEIPEIRKRKDESFNNNNINPITKKIDEIYNKISDHCDVTEVNLKSPTADQPSTDVLQNHERNINHSKEVLINGRNVNIEDQSVVELYFKDQKLNQQKLLSFCNKLLDVNSSFEFPEEFKAAQCNCSQYSENCQSCKHFVNLMDMLCTSVASYCDSKTKLVSFKPDDNFESSDIGDTFQQNIKNNTNVHQHNPKEECENLHVQLPNLKVQDASKNVQEIFSRSGNNSSGESNESTDQRDRIFKNIVDCVSGSTTYNNDYIPSLFQPLSCPVLATNTSSFEFLYEESSSSENQEFSRDLVYANLTRPFDQTFNFSMSQYNVETPFFRRSSCFSPTGSTESGYASIKSGNCRKHSLANFFKKPNIAPLLKLPILQRTKTDLSKFCEQKSQGELKKSILYEKMRKNCQLYAKKVRESSEKNVTEKVEDYQEYSLAFLLRKDSTLMCESFAVNQHSSTHSCIASDAYNKDDELDAEELINVENNKELDMDKFAKNGCKLVLSNEYLRTDSITYLGPEIFNPDEEIICTVSQSQFGSKKDSENTILVNTDSSFTLDFSLDSNNPFVPSKDVLAQRFFASLLSIYEKEIELCNELFKNDEFLKNVLLPAVKEKKNQEKRNKRGRFSRFFRRNMQEKQKGAEKNKYKQTENSQVKALAKLQSLASNAKKCFTMLAEAVKVNENIDDEIKICGLLKLLERIESGDFYMIKNDGDSNIEEDIQSQVKEAFINIYEICEKEAKKAKRNIGVREINLIKGFVSKYKIGLLSKTDIVACYIGRGRIQTEAQLKAAVTYLMRSQANQVNIQEFEEYCKFTK